MHWVAPSEIETAAALGKRFWDTAEQAMPAPPFAETDVMLRQTCVTRFSVPAKVGGEL
jgi:hypothetical protein